MSFKFPSRPNVKDTDEVVNFKCRRKNPECSSMQAIIRKIRPGVTQYVCVTCGNTVGVPQGGAVHL